MGSVNKGSTGRNKDNSRETGVVGMGAAMLPRAGMEGPRESFLLPGPYRGSMAGTYWLAEGFLYCQASGTFWKLIHHHDLSLPSRCQEMVLRRVLCSSQGRSGAAPPPQGNHEAGSEEAAADPKHTVPFRPGRASWPHTRTETLSQHRQRPELGNKRQQIKRGTCAKMPLI